MIQHAATLVPAKSGERKGASGAGRAPIPKNRRGNSSPREHALPPRRPTRHGRSKHTHGPLFSFACTTARPGSEIYKNWLTRTMRNALQAAASLAYVLSG